MEVMISYNAVDKKIALEVLKFLHSMEDINPWIDFTDKAPNQSYESYLEDAMGQCEVMIAIYTPSTPSSKTALLDYKKARAKAVPVVTFKLADVIANDEMNDLIASGETVSCAGMKWQEALAKLKESLEKHR